MLIEKRYVFDIIKMWQYITGYGNQLNFIRYFLFVMGRTDHWRKTIVFVSEGGENRFK
jgi:hypothetical protein